MSLDVTLYDNKITDVLSMLDDIREHGEIDKKSDAMLRDCINLLNEDDGAKEVYSSNITHNLGKMAEAAGIYKALWRPEEIGITRARELIPLLTPALKTLEARPERFKEFDSPNGWGMYEHFVPLFVNIWRLVLSGRMQWWR